MAMETLWVLTKTIPKVIPKRQPKKIPNMRFDSFSRERKVFLWGMRGTEDGMFGNEEGEEDLKTLIVSN